VKQNYEKLFIRFAWMLTVCIASALCCLLLYSFDNKYTAAGPQAQDGLLLLGEETLAEHPVIFLVDGWEYYGGRLLRAQDFSSGQPKPDEIIYIGQYGGFEAGHLSASPHGSASYRLTIHIPEEPQSYTLELPEIFSAYRLYIDGEQAAVMGTPESADYRPETGNRTVTFKAGGEIELLFAVSDFTHLYSGLVYPPAFGKPEAVSAMLSARLIFRSLFAAFALAIGLLSALVGVLGKRNVMALLYGLLCLCFVGYVAYPLWQAFPGSYRPLYALENFCYCALLMVVILLQRSLQSSHGRWSRTIITFGMFACFASLSMPFLLPSGSLWVMYGYSYLITVFQWLAVALITVTAVRALWKDAAHSGTLMCGILAFDVALVMDRMLPLHEPIVTGWFPELTGFVLVLCIGISVGQEMAAKYRDSTVLTERNIDMERLLVMQRASYDLLTEKIEEAKSARHDLRHHFVMIGGFVQNHEYQRLAEYVAEYGIAVEQDRALRYSENDVVNVLLHHYVQLANKQEIKFELRLTIHRDTGIADADLCAVLSNLLENAVEACSRQSGERLITLSIAQDEAALYIHMENSTDGKVIQKGCGFLSSKAAARRGYGLESIKTIANRYAGEAGFRFDRTTDVFTSTVLLVSSLEDIAD
jgi:hypothetical protein